MRQGRLGVLVQVHVKILIDMDSSKYPQASLKDCVQCNEAGELTLSLFVAVAGAVTTDKFAESTTPFLKIYDVVADNMAFKFDKDAFLVQVNNLGNSLAAAGRANLNIETYSKVAASMNAQIDVLDDLLHVSLSQ